MGVFRTDPIGELSGLTFLDLSWFSFLRRMDLFFFLFGENVG